MPSRAGAAAETTAAASGEPRLRSSGTAIEGVPGDHVLMPARAADALKTN
jgi:hypothetical protein